MEHVFFNKGDKNAPESIKDRNGDIALHYCKICRQAEGELEKECPGKNVWGKD